MTFAGEDTLAIHTIAAAACRVLRDLNAKRGRNVLAEEWRDNWLSVARGFVRGELPPERLRVFKEDAAAWKVITWLADHVKRLGPEKKISELAAHIGVDLS